MAFAGTVWQAAGGGGRVKVGIETDRGQWVQALSPAGYEVFAINPMLSDPDLDLYR